MAQLRDVPIVLRSAGPWEMFKRVWRQVGEDNLFTLAAALSYSWLFSIFPFFIFLLTLLPYVPAKYRDEAQVRISETVHDAMPKAAKAITDNLDALLKKPHSGLLSVGIVLTLWGASGGMAATMAAIDACYDVETGRPFYIQRPLAIGLTVVVASLIVGVLILLPVSSTIIKLVTQWKVFTD